MSKCELCPRYMSPQEEHARKLAVQTKIEYYNTVFKLTRLLTEKELRTLIEELEAVTLHRRKI